jgi:transglutaminase-like putative cysteine protease
MAFNRETYLQPSDLCDFSESPAIRRKALALTASCGNREQRFGKIYAYVKELPYGLEDWDLRASGVLRKGWGMCSGKTNLLVALLRSVGIPARYRIYRIEADMELIDRDKSVTTLIARCGWDGGFTVTRGVTPQWK